jgi:hypothetical protein
VDADWAAGRLPGEPGADGVAAGGSRAPQAALVPRESWLAADLLPTGGDAAAVAAGRAHYEAARARLQEAGRTVDASDVNYWELASLGQRACALEAEAGWLAAGRPDWPIGQDGPRTLITIS